jgi:hypothetical protein
MARHSRPAVLDDVQVEIITFLVQQAKRSNYWFSRFGIAKGIKRGDNLVKPAIEGLAVMGFLSMRDADGDNINYLISLRKEYR